jgi:hypothetical protein
MRNMNKSFQKFLAASVSAVVVASAVAPVVPINVLSAEAAAKDFKDVDKESYYYEAVMNLSSRGVINGFTDNTFRPNEQVTRAQAAAIIAASLGLTGKSASNPGFKDVQEGAWHHQAISALVERKIMSGVDKEHFHPNKPVTRAELSKMIGLAFNLKPSTSTSKKFSDVPEKSWYSGFVGAMIDNKITSGMTTTTFAPDGKVTRGQMAAFIFRAEKTFAKAVAIEKVSNDSVTISGATYTLADSVKTILNPANEAALKNADIKFTADNGTITQITYLELKTSGTSNNHLTLDAKGGTVDGHVKISADNVTVKNLTTKGNFELAKEVQTSFTSDKLTVEGKTIITDEAAQTTFTKASSDKIYKSLTKTISQPVFKKAAEAAPKTNITFENATLKVVEVKKQDVKVGSKGTTKLEELSVSSNATITATEGVTIPKLTVQQGASQVEVNGAVQQLSVQSTDTFTLSGKANIDKLNINQKANVNLQSTGEIKEINSTNKETQITVNKDTKVGNVNVPEGTNVGDIITNYDEVKGNIEQIGGKTNPDAQPPAPPAPTPQPPAPDTMAPRLTNVTHEAPTHNSVDVKFTSSESGKVYYVALPAADPVPTKQQIKAGQDSTGAAAANKGSISVMDHTPTTIAVTGLTAETSYKIYLAAEDAATNLSDAVTLDVTTAEPDTTAPTIDPTHFGVDSVSTTSIDLKIKVNENATAYYVLLPENAVVPTVQQLKEGKDANNVPAMRSGTILLRPNHPHVRPINNLTDATKYKLYTVIEDAFGNQTEIFNFTAETLAEQTPPDVGQPAPVVEYASITKGFAFGSTELSLPYETGARYAIKVTESAVTVPNVGDSLPAETISYQVGDSIYNTSPGKFLQLYQVDANGKVLKFYQAEITEAMIQSRYEPRISFTQNQVQLKFNAPIVSSALTNTTIDSIISSLVVRGANNLRLSEEDIQSIEWDASNAALPQLILNMKTNFQVSIPYIVDLQLIPNKVEYDGAGRGQFSYGMTMASGGQYASILVPYIKELAGTTEDRQKADDVMKWLSLLSHSRELQNVTHTNRYLYQKLIAENQSNITDITSLQTYINLANDGGTTTPPTDPGTITLDPKMLYNGHSFKVYKYELLDMVENSHGLSLTSVESSRPEVLETLLDDQGYLHLNPKSSGVSTVTVTLSDGRKVEMELHVGDLSYGLEALNAMSLSGEFYDSYRYEITRAILEGTAEFNVSGNTIYQKEYDFFKEKVAEWMIRKKPTGGYASVADVISTFNMVVETVKALEEESRKYRYNIDVLSTVGNDNQPVDVTSRIYYYPDVTLDGTVAKQIVVNQYFGEHLQLGEDGKVMLVKNNTGNASVQESISITFEKNGITKNHHISANVIQQGVQLTNPIVEINSNYPIQVTRPGQDVYFYVSSDYQIDEIIAEQNGQRVKVSYLANSGENREMYKVTLGEVNGSDQQLTITARIADQTGTDSIVLEDWTWPIITSVQKDTARSRFVVTFSEPVQKRSETTNFNEAFRVSQGEVLNVTQVDERTFNVEVSDINADYLETPQSVHGYMMDFSDSIYSSGDVFVFNPTTAVLNEVFAKVNQSEPLSIYEVSSRNAVYLVDGDDFSYGTIERPDSFYDVHVEDLLLNDSEEQALEKIDAYFFSPQYHPYKDLEYIGVDGYKVTGSLVSNDNGGVALSQSIYFFAKFRAVSGDIIYSQKRSGLWVNEVDKDYAMELVNNLLGKIPADLTGYGHSDLDGYERDLTFQINLLKTLGATDAEIQGLSNYAKYEALKALVEQLNNN